MLETKPSKSAKKREFLALQKLGEKLLHVPQADLEEMDIDEKLLDAVLEARSIKSRGALRRQKQYIGKIMRQVDAEPVQAALDRLQARKS